MGADTDKMRDQHRSMNEIPPNNMGSELQPSHYAHISQGQSLNLIGQYVIIVLERERSNWSLERTRNCSRSVAG